MIVKEINQCIEDMLIAASTGKITLQMQIRAYDLLDKLLEMQSVGVAGPAENFCEQYYTLEEDLKAAFDEAALQLEAQGEMTPFVKVLDDAAEKARRATLLHETAKQTFELWKTGGFFERNKALRNLRKLAGFRLESSRIGNYVAKTFDLMNEANAECARAQQALFSANMSYKIKPGLYARIASTLQMESVVGRVGL